ncbi:hypothetical protein [Mycobacterium sp. NPDC050441]
MAKRVVVSRDAVKRAANRRGPQYGGERRSSSTVASTAAGI